jgi:hypothetical protein
VEKLEISEISNFSTLIWYTVIRVVDFDHILVTVFVLEGTTCTKANGWDWYSPRQKRPLWYGWQKSKVGFHKLLLCVVSFGRLPSHAVCGHLPILPPQIATPKPRRNAMPDFHTTLTHPPNLDAADVAAAGRA